MKVHSKALVTSVFCQQHKMHTAAHQGVSHICSHRAWIHKSCISQHPTAVYDMLDVQATIQGALGSAPLMLIQSRLKNKPDYAQYEDWGNVILHATAFSIILSAPVGLLVIALLGPVWLKQVLLTCATALCYCTVLCFFMLIMLALFSACVCVRVSLCGVLSVDSPSAAQYCIAASSIVLSCTGEG